MLDEALAAKEAALFKFLREYKRPAIAFSGGVDSSVLLAACRRAGVDVQPIMADTTAVPAFEKDDAARVAEETQTVLHTFSYDPTVDPQFRANDARRCYYCKKRLMAAIKEKAQALGCDVVLDGTNADDTGDYRPGMRAAQEEGIISPLLVCGFTKADVRMLADNYSLSVAQKPAYACLASRIAYGEEITTSKLRMVEQAEASLRALGLCDVRVRCHGNLARIEVRPEQIALAASGMREEILKLVREAGFTYVSLDMQGYRTGSMNTTLQE